ncbi:MAG: hypothetical protein JZU63_06595, partial [Rhodoferax sp.]|nr:hypothetical protein [Rhodoferax sp.]
VTVKNRTPKRIRSWLEPFLADAYVGARNECFVFGPTDVKRFFDPDLAGAYVTGLSYIMALDYVCAVMSKEVSDCRAHVAG